MKQGIHPKWFEEAKVYCACGNTFVVGASKPEIRIDICGKCHPFFTGEMKFVDTLGRVERFQQKQQKAQGLRAQLVDKKKKKQEERIAAEHRPRSLKEMLMSQK